ncbi:MAG: hypothetical protein KJO98_15995 [Rhodothermia bacterium]|nr:hypothetical protein [Rhodothermia bacterium]
MRSTLLTVVVIHLSIPVLAQDLPTASDVRGAYERLSFDDALELAAQVTENADAYLPRELVDVHTVAGLILISRNDRSGARSHFAAALSLDPDLTLDPVFASPDVVDFFELVKRESASASSAQPPPVRYIPVEDPRAGAALRSMLIPGWGQMYKGQQTKGALMMGVWGLAATGTVASHFIRSNREDRYLAETDPLAVGDRFDDFNRWHKIRNNLALTTVAIWAAAYVDALVVGTGRTSAERRGPRVQLTYRPDLSGDHTLTLRIPIAAGVQDLHKP